MKMSSPSKKENIATGSPTRGNIPDDLVERVTNSGRKLVIKCSRLLQSGEDDVDRTRQPNGSPKTFTPKRFFKNDKPKKNLECSKTNNSHQKKKMEESSPLKAQKVEEGKDVSPSQKAPTEKLEYIKKIGKVRGLRDDEIVDLLEDDDSDHEVMCIDGSDAEAESDVEELPEKSRVVESEKTSSGKNENNKKDGKVSSMCRECGDTFKSPEEREGHECDQFEIKTSKKAGKDTPSRKPMEREVTKKKYKCLDCEKTFDDMKKRDDHEIEHDDEIQLLPVRKSPTGYVDDWFTSEVLELVHFI